MNRTGYLLLLPLLGALLSTCCMGTKCDPTDLGAGIRFRNAAGTDLLFGPGRAYDPDSVRLYSVTGGDTLRHDAFAGSYSNASADSLLFVSFRSERYETVYVAFGADVDTLQVAYARDDGGACCPDSYRVQILHYNGAPVPRNSANQYLIRK
ncbi:hypothetical protein GCM10023184_47350 [Flaviaesturariibacter amylovorans]|uniref:Secreted protein n=2 Tax=Flaviaesturariibacter amylovorans TaxID=1084520 RepID=A0ABP8HVI5_9BACT